MTEIMEASDYLARPRTKMKAEAVVKTTITVDLKAFTTFDLISELESRGHVVDADCAMELDTEDLLKELCTRNSPIHFGKVPLDALIQSLRRFDCPAEIMDQLLEWDSTPVVTRESLNTWLALSR